MTPARWTLAAVACCAVVIVFSLWAMNRDHRALLSARQDAEAAHLELAHQTVESSETRRQLQSSVEDLIAKNAELATAVEAAKAAAPSARPVSASELETSPERVVQIAQVTTMAQAVGGVVQTQPAPAAGAAVQPTACALSAGESAWFRVDLIELQTRERNTLVVGTASLLAQGLDLQDRTVLGPVRFQSAVSSSAALAPPQEPRWGVELEATCQRAGCGVGGGVLFPPLALLGLRLEGRAGVLAGPDVAALAALGVRW